MIQGQSFAEGRSAYVGYEELTDLAEYYPAAAREDLMALSTGYQRRNEGEVLELAALAADLSVPHLLDLFRESDPDRQVIEALERHYRQPLSESLQRLEELDDSQMEGLVDAVKGIYFEVLVRDRLNDGERVGELWLQQGQRAELARDPGEDGWDLEIFDVRGETVEELQLKAVKDMGEISKALRAHDFKVVAPDHIDSTSEKIIGTDISLEQITEDTNEQLSEFSEGTIKNAVDGAAETVEPAWDIIPLGSALVIGVTEGRRYLMGRATLQESMTGVGRRSARSLTYHTVGAALSATGLGIVSIPIVMGARVAESRITGAVDLADNLVARTDDLTVLEFAP